MTERPLAYSINRLHEAAPWGRSTSYKLVREGRLPARRLGASTFILREDLERFIKSLDRVVAEDAS
jgi:excisionase family DNA binding protein